AQLSGAVKDSSGGAIADAIVTAVRTTDGARRVARSDEDGEYVLASLGEGPYKVIVRKLGFQTVTRLGLTLGGGDSAGVDFTMTIGSVREIVTITSDAESMNTEDASVGGRIARQWFDMLPLNGNTFTAALDLLPGIVLTPASGGEPGQFSSA